MIQPPVGAAKWVPSTSTGAIGLLARGSARASRAPAADRRRSATDQSRSQHWIGWCIRSPVITASLAPDRIRTLTWPGVWPGVGSSAHLAAIDVVALDQVGEAGIDHRLHRIDEDLALVGVARSPTSASSSMRPNR